MASVQRVLDKQVEIFSAIVNHPSIFPSACPAVKEAIIKKYMSLMNFALQPLLERDFASLTKEEQSYISFINHQICMEISNTAEINGQIEAYSVIAFRAAADSITRSEVCIDVSDSVSLGVPLIGPGNGELGFLNGLITGQNPYFSTYMFMGSDYANGQFLGANLRPLFADLVRLNTELLRFEINGITQIFQGVQGVVGPGLQAIGADVTGLAKEAAHFMVGGIEHLIHDIDMDCCNGSSGDCHHHHHHHHSSSDCGNDLGAAILCVLIVAALAGCWQARVPHTIMAMTLRAPVNVAQTLSSTVHLDPRALLRLAMTALAAGGSYGLIHEIESSSLAQEHKITSGIFLAIAMLFLYTTAYWASEKANQHLFGPKDLKLPELSLENIVAAVQSGKKLFDLYREYTNAVNVIKDAEPGRGFPTSPAREGNRFAYLVGCDSGPSEARETLNRLVSQTYTTAQSGMGAAAQPSVSQLELAKSSPDPTNN